MIRKIKNLGHFIRALLAVFFYRFPASSLTVIGVTGTDGKTTTVHLIGAILKEAGLKIATISTLGAYLGNEKVSIGLHVTTPSPWLLQKLLRRIVDCGFTHVVLETTSHGLDQHRLLGCNFKIGVATNVTHEHLDYHETYENYLKTKAKLFQRAKIVVLNRDDQSYFLLSHVPCPMSHVIIYAVKNKADFTPETFPFKTSLLGEHNLYNCLAAIAVAKSLGIKDEIVKKALADFAGLGGRLEEVDEGQSFKVFVDFAHTPAAFEEILKTIRGLTKGKIIHVFGCTGKRDRQKRPLMGETSARLSDKIILTHEDTYGEDAKKIIEEIEPGVVKGGKVLGETYWKVEQRDAAIKKAIQMAKRGDMVIITGVGHQETLNLGNKEMPWSDQEEVRKAIKERLK